MARVTRAYPTAHRYYHSSASRLFRATPPVTLRAINTIKADHHLLDVDLFREQAFEPEQPALVTTNEKPWKRLPSSTQMPALKKWFQAWRDGNGKVKYEYHYILKTEYLRQFGDCVVPYELVTMPSAGNLQDHPLARIHRHLSWYQRVRKTGTWSNLPSPPPRSVGEETVPRQHPDASESSNDRRTTNFHSFHAPLELFIHATRRTKEINPTGDTPPDKKYTFHIPNLYIAQAQLSSLPDALRADLPTPRLVQKVGKGDIYDANLWMGTPPTYTPLHRDPNPNFFVQLASNKKVRLFRPEIGLLIFQRVREKLGLPASAVFRGEEMMMDPERGILEAAVWNCSPDIDGYEVTVQPGDALFIPKGWWHSVKSVGPGVNASVNWWFR